MTLYITKYNSIFRVNGAVVKEFGMVHKGQFEFVAADDPAALIRIRVGEVFESVEPIQSALIAFLLENGVERVSVHE